MGLVCDTMATTEATKGRAKVRVGRKARLNEKGKGPERRKKRRAKDEENGPGEFSEGGRDF